MNRTGDGINDTSHWETARGVWVRLADRTFGAVVLGSGQAIEFLVEKVFTILEGD